MGWNLLRRKTVALAACVLVLSAVCSGGQASQGRSPEEAALPAAAVLNADPAVSVDTALLSASLPPLQSHRGEELYSLSFPDEAIIDGWVEIYLSKKREWLQAVLERMPAYRAFIASEIRDLGLPRELLFIPAVESGFQIKATSPRGAAGLWQLMRNTASPYGLVMDQWLDERRDFWKATKASLEKLEGDFERFGDWCLAIAAYNCGSSRLSRVIRESGISDFWTMRRKGLLPKETASFVPQFLALARILSYPGRYGLEVSWNAAVEWVRVPVDKTVDLRLLSRESGVPLETLLGGNAELTMALTPPISYRYMLKVPAETRPAVESALAGSALPMIDFRIHVVESGDTLSGIARTYGVTVDLLKELNPTVKPLALRIGSRLLIPKTGAPKVKAGAAPRQKGLSG